MALRPAHLLPPKRLSTPRLDRRISPTNRGLLPGTPVPTGTGLSPASLIQLPGRTIGRAQRVEDAVEIGIFVWDEFDACTQLFSDFRDQVDVEAGVFRHA